MPLLTDEIADALNAGGLIKFPKMQGQTGLFFDVSRDQIVQDSYSCHNLTLDGNNILMTCLEEKAKEYNCVNIQTLDQVSAIGPVKIPGYVYTGNFSGCVFYLYKTGAKEVTGVHTYSGMKTKIKKRWFRKNKITQVLHEFGPTDYYTRHPARQICRYPTRGELNVGAFIGDPNSEDSLNFLACVELTKVTTFLFATKGSVEGGKVKRVLNTYEATY
jgi:hypothetical protein